MSSNRGPTESGIRWRKAAAWMGIAMAVASVLVGSIGLILESKPWIESYGFGGLPWVVPLGGGRLGLVFVNFGLRDSAVFYGVVDAEGNWVVDPVAVTPKGPGGYQSAVEATPRLDSNGRLHIAWTHWDSINDRVTHHYVQADATSGRVLVAAGPVGGISAEEIYIGAQQPGIFVASDEVQILWPANGSQMISRIGFDGTLLEPPYPVAQVDNASFFPPRTMVPGGVQYIDGTASVVNDSGSTFYLWTHARTWYTGRTYHREIDLNLRSEGPRGTVEVTLFSTEDTWWWGKPRAPLFASLTAIGATAIGYVAVRQLYIRRARRLGVFLHPAGEDIPYVAPPVRSAFRVLVIALSVYSGSAACAAASAGLWFLAGQAATRQDPVTGPLGLAGSLTLLASVILALAAFSLLIIAFAHLKKARDVASPPVSRAIKRSRLAVLTAYGLLLPAAALSPLFFFKGGFAVAEIPILLAATGSALAFLAALAPPVQLLRRRGRMLGWTAIALGAAAVVVEASLAVSGSLRGQVFPSLPFGGYPFPLVNWNVPFGSSIAASSAMLAWAYRGLTAANEPDQSPESALRPA